MTWEEVERAHKKKDAGLLVFEAKQAVARFEKMGDLFEPVLELKQQLPDLKGVGGFRSRRKARSQFRIAAQADDAPEDVRPRPRREETGKKPAVRED